MFQKNHASNSLELLSPSVKSALDHHLFVTLTRDSSLSILCYDSVLCYLSNVISHESIDEIEFNLKHNFTQEQLEEAYYNLQNSLHYSLSVINSSINHHEFEIFEQCINSLTNSSRLISTIQTIYSNNLFSSLPIFVTSYQNHTIQNVQDFEKIDTSLPTIVDLHAQMTDLKEHLLTLCQLADSAKNLPLPTAPLWSLSTAAPTESSILTDQCCLRTCCQHTSNQVLTPTIDSPSSSWSSLDLDKSPMTTLNQTIPGFIRNPVSNFLIPRASNINDITSSIISMNDNMSSDDEQSINSKIGSVVVKRDDDLWIYPIGIDVRKSKVYSSEYNRSQSLFNSINGANDRNRTFMRTNSFDGENFSKDNDSEKLQSHSKRHKKEKGSKVHSENKHTNCLDV